MWGKKAVMSMNQLLYVTYYVAYPSFPFSLCLYRSKYELLWKKVSRDFEKTRPCYKGGKKCFIIYPLLPLLSKNSDFCNS